MKKIAKRVKAAAKALFGKNPYEVSDICTYEEKRDYIGELNDEALFADGYESALVGYVMACQQHEAIPAYDYHKMIDILIERDGMSLEEAIEMIDFNTLQAYMGKNTPKYVVLFKDGEEV